MRLLGFYSDWDCLNEHYVVRICESRLDGLRVSRERRWWMSGGRKSRKRGRSTPKENCDTYDLWTGELTREPLQE